MGEYLTEKHIAEFKEAFAMIHKNKDSQTVTTKNLGLMMRALGMEPSEVELKDMINEVDADGSGDIDFPEFLAMMARRQKRDELQAEVESTFQLFDLDKDGLIGPKELKEVMISMGEVITDEEIAQIMEEADPHKNGYITMEDFLRMYDSLMPTTQ